MYLILRSDLNSDTTFPLEILYLHLIIVVQSLGRVRLFVTSWTTAHHTSLSFTIYRSFLKLLSIELAMPSNHLIFCHPLLLLPSIFPSIRVFSNESGLFQWVRSFPMSRLFASGGQSIGASASVLPMNIQVWCSLGLTSLILLQSRGLSRVFPITTVRNSLILSLVYGPNLISIHDYWKDHSLLYRLLSAKWCLYLFLNLYWDFIKFAVEMLISPSPSKHKSFPKMDLILKFK